MGKKVKEIIEKELKEKTGALDLSYCELVKIPQEIGEMDWLTTLSLSNNQIVKIEGLESLSSLTTLSLSNNQIVKIEGLESLSSLTTLSLYNNQIVKIEGLESLSSLTTLSLENNQIVKIEGLESLFSLVVLFFQKNQIREIEGLLSLENLKILDLENNPIRQIPSEYQDYLNSLEFLDLKGTKIEDIQVFYQNIEKGKRILWEDLEILSGRTPNTKDYFECTINNRTFHVKKGINVKNCKNLTSGLVASIKSGSDALLNYIKEPREKLFEARVLVLGEPRAGKTTLRKKLLDVGSSMPSEQESTKAFEIEIEPYNCEIKKDGQKEQLQYHLWDFGGQDYYRLLHQLFIAEQSVYVIVVGTDRNKTEEELEFWLDTIERLSKDEQQQYGPVILLQNPKNNRPGGEFKDLKSRYTFWQQTKPFIINLNALNDKETSFNNKELLEFRDFEKYLSRSFCQLDHVGKEIPVKWIAIREALLKEKKKLDIY